MMGKSETLPTIWEIPDDLWEQIHPVILEMDPPKPTGRKRVDPRRILVGIIFRMRSGCHWNRLPRELGVWTGNGRLPRFDRLRSAMGKARFGGIQPFATPRTGVRRAASGASWLTGAEVH